MAKTYIVGDIHGCYKELEEMLAIIQFSGDDKLFLVGDYIDRGPDSVKVLEWLENRGDNVYPIKGNHDVEFQGYLEIMIAVDEQECLQTDLSSVEDSLALYETTQYLLKRQGKAAEAFFDVYGTVYDMLKNKNLSADRLLKWSEMISEFPYYYKVKVRGRECVIVHAGYTEDKKLTEEEKKAFYL